MTVALDSLCISVDVRTNVLVNAASIVLELLLNFIWLRGVAS